MIEPDHWLKPITQRGVRSVSQEERFQEIQEKKNQLEAVKIKRIQDHMNRWHDFRKQKEQMLDRAAFLIKRKSKVTTLISAITVFNILSTMMENIILLKEKV